MPHVIVEYSANIEAEITPQRLVEEIHAAAITSGIAEPVAVRTRLMRREFYRVGDGAPENAFVHIDIRARKGRTLEQRKTMVQTIYDQANKTLDVVFKARPLALTVEIHEIDSETRLLRNGLREREAPGKGERRMSGALDKTIARAEEFLKRFRDKPVAHLIDGKPDPGNGQTFETHSPIDNSVIAQVARGGAAEIDNAAKAATRAFRTGWSRTTGDERRKLLHRIADAIEARADEIALIEMHRYRPADPLHVEGGAARRGELPLLCRPRAGRARRPVAADRHASQLHHPPADRPRRHHHALEHAVHAVDLEDRAGTRGRLHRGAQAGRMEPAHRGAARRRSALEAGPAARRAQHWCTASARTPARR